MIQLQGIWRDRNIPCKTKIKLAKTLLFSIFSFEAETWTLRKADCDHIDTFKMCWRRKFYIPWDGLPQNASIFAGLNIKPKLTPTCLRKVFDFFGHLARKEGNNPHKGSNSWSPGIQLQKTERTYSN